jgi:prolyl-tRNA synthetase
VEVVADRRARGGRDWVVGANRLDHHATGANPGRDFRVDRWEDVSAAREGDPCPRCGAALAVERSIEVGHTFQLGTRYSEPLRAGFAAEDGSWRPFVMGCYGIGVSRVVASVVEQHRDDAGIAWPRALAPYEVVVIATNLDREDVVAAAEGVYRALQGLGIETVLDDRPESAGVRFADADLIGLPVQVVVGRRGLAEGVADLKIRATGERSRAPLSDAAPAAAELLGAAP